MPSGLENPDEGYRIDTVDLRGTRVGALVGGTEGFSYEILQTVDGKYAHSAFVGGGGEEARDFAGGVSVGSGLLPLDPPEPGDNWSSPRSTPGPSAA